MRIVIYYEKEYKNFAHNARNYAAKICGKLPFDYIEIRICEKDSFFINERNLFLSLKPDTEFTNFTSKTLLMLYRARTSALFGDLPEPLLEMISRRDMAASFPENLINMCYSELISSNVNTTRDFLRANLPWLAFHGIDNWNREFLRKMVKGRFPITRKLILAMKKDMYNEKNLDKAAKLCEEICR